MPGERLCIYVRSVSFPAIETRRLFSCRRHHREQNKSTCRERRGIAALENLSPRESYPAAWGGIDLWTDPQRDFVLLFRRLA
jgi:hypothetical protein